MAHRSAGLQLPKGYHIDGQVQPPRLKVRNDNRGSAFPSTRCALWNHRATGQVTLLDISEYRNPVVTLEEKTIRLVHHYLQASGSENYSCVLIGSVTPEADGGSVRISIDRFDPDGRDNMTEIPGEIYIPLEVRGRGSSTDDAYHHSDQEYSWSLKILHHQCSSKDKVDLCRLFSIRGLCSYTHSKDYYTFNIHFDVVSPGIKFQMTPINSVPIVPTALSKNLSGPMSLSEVQGEPKTGYLTMDHTRKLLFVLESDPKVHTLPMVGIWLSGVSNIGDPFVWASCIRYLKNSSIQDRVCYPPEPFLVVLYSPLHSRPEFYECATSSGKVDLNFQLFTCQEVIQLHKNMPDRAQSPLELEVYLAEAGPRKDCFDTALESNKELLAAPSSTQTRVSSHLSNSLEDITPRALPAPHHIKAHAMKPSVPEVSLIFDDHRDHLVPRQSLNAATSSRQTPTPIERQDCVSQPQQSDSYREPLKPVNRPMHTGLVSQYKPAPASNIGRPSTADHHQLQAVYDENSGTYYYVPRVHNKGNVGNVVPHSIPHASSGQYVSHNVGYQPRLQTSQQQVAAYPTSQMHSGTYQQYPASVAAYTHPRLPSPRLASHPSALPPYDPRQFQEPQRGVVHPPQTPDQSGPLPASSTTDSYSRQTMHHTQQSAPIVSGAILSGASLGPSTPWDSSTVHRSHPSSQQQIPNSQYPSATVPSLHAPSGLPGSNSIPPEVFALLKQQDEQLRDLRQQLSQLLANQSASVQDSSISNEAPKKVLVSTETQMSNNSTPVKQKPQGVDKKTCSIAINTSLFWPNSTGDKTLVEDEDLIRQTETLAREADGSGSTGYGSKPNTPEHTAYQQQDSPEAPRSNDTLTSFGELHLTQELQDKPEDDSMVSDMVLDMPAYMSLSPEKFSQRSTESSGYNDTDESNKSPMLGESVSMYQRQEFSVSDDEDHGVGDCDPEAELLYKDQRKFYENLIGNVKKFIQTHDSSVETTGSDGYTQEGDILDTTVTPPSEDIQLKTRPDISAMSVDVAKATREQLVKMGIDLDNVGMEQTHNGKGSDSTFFMDPSLFPKINYVSMMLDGDSDVSTDADALAMKYLSDEQLTELAKLRKQTPQHATRHDAALDHILSGRRMRPGEVSMYSPSNNMSFATKKYMEKYGLLNGIGNTTDNTLNDTNKEDDSGAALMNVKALLQRLNDSSFHSPQADPRRSSMPQAKSKLDFSQASSGSSQSSGRPQYHSDCESFDIYSKPTSTPAHAAAMHKNSIHSDTTPHGTPKQAPKHKCRPQGGESSPFQMFDKSTKPLVHSDPRTGNAVAPSFGAYFGVEGQPTRGQRLKTSDNIRSNERVLDIQRLKDLPKLL